ncbi:MAG: DMT family transporter [Desulfobacterales bacterium]
MIGETHIWLVLSLLTALAVSSQEAFTKKFFSHLSAYEMSAYQLIYSLPLFGIVLPWIHVPPLERVFFWAFLVSVPLNGIAFLLHMLAIKSSPLSLTIPYLAFTPVFMIATGFIFLGEAPSIYGAGGIFCVCIGGYILNLTPGKWTLLGPFKVFFKETGSWVMLIVAFLYGFAAVIGKLAIVHSSPVFFSVSFFVVFNFSMVLFLLVIKKVRLRTFAHEPLKGMLVGCFLFIHILLHGYAISMVTAAYMISVKRLSVLFGIIYGWIFFKESNLMIRFSGAVFMVSGAVLIMLKG